MANNNIDRMNHSIGDYLASLAEGLADAQSQLDAMGEDENHSGHRYHIPRLDFDLKLEFELEEPSAPDDDSTGRVGKMPMRRLMVYKPDQDNDGQSSYSGTSNLSGSIVAVPSSNQQQLLELSSELTERPVQGRDERSRLGVSVLVLSSQDQPLPDVEVEANIDHARSRQLTEKLGGRYDRDAVELMEGLLLSDPEGHADTELVIRDGATPPLQVVITLDCQGLTETLRYRLADDSEDDES